jgi:hypothetical protein
MQMPANTRRTIFDATEAGGSAIGNENRDPPPPPLPYTVEQLFTQFLGSQRNMESMQQNMKATLRNIADNTRHGLN